MYHTDNDTGTEELAHVEMISAMLYQLTKDLSIDEIKKSGFDKYFVDIKSGRSVIFYYTENNWFHCAGAYMLKHIQSDKCIVNAINKLRLLLANLHGDDAVIGCARQYK